MFREKAVQHASHRLHGDVVVLPTISSLLLTFVILLFLIAIVLFLANGTYPRKVTAFGVIEPDEGLSKVYAERTGTVREVKVRIGDFIDENSPLILINGDQYLGDGRALTESLLTSLREERKSVIASIERARVRHPIEISNIDNDILSIQSELMFIEEQIAALDQRYKITHKLYQSAASLEKKGHISTEALSLQQEKVSMIRSDLAALKRSKSVREFELTELKGKRQLMPGTQEDKIAALLQQQRDIDEEILKQEAIQSYTLKAPIAGIVTGLQVKPGQKPPLNSPLVTIIPSDTTYSAQIFVPVRNAGFLKKGKDVSIRYDAYPFQKFGIYDGKIESIERTVIMPEEARKHSVLLNEPVYRVQVKLAQQWVDTFGEQTMLMPGMTLETDIKLEERSLLEWLLEPIFSLKGRL
ncbi:HlyD family efflux transporter periplasmic adaptor subunit [Motilimonas sp. E26]|uniref:HlyD family secretion protein n=1 Tax=Motilimonas sp. E26 TaxID=2865674 RepID=UPI001E3ED2A4|nr:HlyD family efflux transporter periplasmic adaptor subunit [Motilimonas sp. E26]MCE0557246.1 HlyD family secretion protein [Motilimonas sp. E26]